MSYFVWEAMATKLDAKHKSRQGIYMFFWKGKKITMKPIGEQTEVFKLEDQSFLSILQS